jgi:two-component system response regulator YesN
MEHTRRILLVDDEPAALQVLQQAIEWHGHDCAWAVRSEDDPYHALELLKHWPADLLITDIHMPTMSGLDLLQEAQRRSSARAMSLSICPLIMNVSEFSL